MESWIVVLMCLTSCFHRVHGMTNWALNKNSSQSSTASIANANLAVDGRKGQIFVVYMTKAVCTHTNESVGDRRWWVDLGQTEKISRVVIYNREEGLEGRLNNFYIEVGYIETGNNKESFKTCRFYAFPNLPIVNASCEGNSPLTGRYVRIRKKTLNAEDVQKKYVTLTLCEVQVYGPDKPKVNLALKKKAFQSTVDFGGTPNLATDGLLSRNFLNVTPVPQCAQTKGNRTLPWWRVDMEEIVNVTNVTIFSQVKANKTLIQNYTIEVGRPQTDGSITYQTCRHFEKTTNGVLKAACNNVVVGQYVRIMKLDRQDKNPLTLCEVEVYGICLSKYPGDRTPGPVDPGDRTPGPVDPVDRKPRPAGGDWTSIIIAIAFSLLFILIILAIAAYVCRRRRNKARPAKADDSEGIKSGGSSVVSMSSAEESKSEASSAGPEEPSAGPEEPSAGPEEPPEAPTAGPEEQSAGPEEPSEGSEAPSEAPTAGPGAAAPAM